MTTATPTKPQTGPLPPQAAPPPAAPAAKQETTPAAGATAGTAVPDVEVPAAYWTDWYCLRFWLAGAAVLVALHLLDALYRLLGLL